MAWLAGWSYRKEITIEGTADGQQTDHQLQLFVHSGSDEDDGNDVFLESHCESFPDDIYFTKSDGETPLDYWVEDAAADPCPIFIEFDSVPEAPGSATFYIYYGKVAQGSSSNGVDTWKDFDDFERGNDGDEVGNGWIEDNGIVEISTERCYKGTRSLKWVGQTGTRPRVWRPWTAGNGYATRLRLYRENGAGYTMAHGNATDCIFMACQNNNDVEYYITSWVDTNHNATPDEWELVEVVDIDFSGKTYDIVVAGVVCSDDTGMRVLGSLEDFIAQNGEIITGKDVWLDHWIIRNWTANPPTWGAWGIEETPGYMSPLPAFRRPS